VIPEQISAWCADNEYGEVLDSKPLSGGCINNGSRLITSSGRSLFLKQNSSTPPDMFAREAEGLRALMVSQGPKVPEPYLFGPDFILIEDLDPATPTNDYWKRFGRQLAQVHLNAGSQFGFDHDNYIGSTAQPNPWTEDGNVFFSESRLGFQAGMALERGLLDSGDADRVNRLGANLREIIPAQPPSLVHGDLWSGNAMTGSSGEPALIDPATHYGWAEAELGMTSLFGGFPAEFYDAYEEINALAPGWRERLPIYNLYHLLNHLNLFGVSYHARVISILDRFA
jgi:fructosamine-3-kinase